MVISVDCFTSRTGLALTSTMGSMILESHIFVSWLMQGCGAAMSAKCDVYGPSVRGRGAVRLNHRRRGEMIRSCCSPPVRLNRPSRCTSKPTFQYFRRVSHHKLWDLWLKIHRSGNPVFLSLYMLANGRIGLTWTISQ